MASRRRLDRQPWIEDRSAIAEANHARCAAFNEAHPVGSSILVWLGTSRDGRPVALVVAAPARFRAGEVEPMVRLQGLGSLGLSRVFEPCTSDRQELFLDGRRIEAEDAQIRVRAQAAEALRAAASLRGISATELVNRLVEAACDGLIDALLEDGAQIRARRRYHKAA